MTCGINRPIEQSNLGSFHKEKVHPPQGAPEVFTHNSATHFEGPDSGFFDGFSEGSKVKLFFFA